MRNDADRLLVASMRRYRRSVASVRTSKLLLNLSRIGIARSRELLDAFSVGKASEPVKEWEIVGTTEIVATCARVAGDAVEDRALPVGKRGALATAKIEGNQVTIQGRGAIFNSRYLCLPDTVDPRGVRGNPER